MESQQTSELPIERVFQVERMRRFLNRSPEEATETALEIYEAYLNLNAQYLQLSAEHRELQQRIKTSIETPPFFRR
jgi:hypothetical protein